jgi:dTDP-4-amino-4,6-dideoxygalactose transaminase
MIQVTKPFLPPLEEYQEYLAGIWKRNWLTNNGPLVNELESRLKTYLGLDHLLFLNNGTVAIQIAIKALDLRGEIITTPFSYVATTSSIVWENCKPVFVDIDPDTLNIDAGKIEAAVTPRTSAILATHVYGNPCDIETIQGIADRHGLKVIYDAAHAFGATYKGKSVFAYGDITTTSFHATKLFHTIEGGAVFTPDPDLLKKMGYLRNFGHDGPEKFASVGINAKNSEFHAAMGLVNLNHIDSILVKRKQQWTQYAEGLKTADLRSIKIQEETCWNYSYYPVIFNSEAALLRSVKILEQNQVSPRRYFYPALNNLNYVEHCDCPVCEDISKCVLCLPLYHDLSGEEIDFVCRLLLQTQD